MEEPLVLQNKCIYLFFSALFVLLCWLSNKAKLQGKNYLQLTELMQVSEQVCQEKKKKKKMQKYLHA